MTERKGDPGVTDPFLARISLPSMEERDPEAMVPMIWPIASPRVRKVLTEQMEDLADHHFLAKVFAAIVGGAAFLLSGAAAYVLLRYGLSLEPNPTIFAVAFAVLFIGAAFFVDRFRSPGPMEIYYAVQSAESGGEVAASEGVGRVFRVLLFGPYLMALAYRKVLETPPPADEPTLDVALRLLPMLHQPLPLYQAELAGIAEREDLRRAAKLLYAMNLADLVLGPGRQLLLTPRTACAQLLRDAETEPSATGGGAAAGEEAPWLDMEPDLVSTAELDTLELVKQAEKMGLDPAESVDIDPVLARTRDGDAGDGEDPDSDEDS